MDENNQNEQTTQNELKQETVNTFNEAKEQMKNINLKEEAKVGKGLFKKIFNDPIGAIKEIVNDEKNSFFKTALLLIAIWLIVILVKQIITAIKYKYIGFNLLTTIKAVIAPIISIVTLTLIFYFVGNKNKKSFVTIITAMSITKIPLIASSIIGFLTFIDLNASKIVNPIATLLQMISIVVSYFAIKFLAGEDEDKTAFMKFVIIEGIYYLVAFVLSFLGISI